MNNVERDLRLSINQRMVADLVLRLCRRCHELADGIEHNGELFVVYSFQFVESLRKIGVAREKLTQTNERPHDFDVHSHCAIGPQHAGKHCDACSVKTQGRFLRPPWPTPLKLDVTDCDFKFVNSCAES